MSVAARSLLVVLVLGSPDRVAAAPEPSVSSELREAHAAFARADFADAIRRFRAAYERSKDPRLLYNVALAHLKRGEREARRADLAAAQRLFRRFLLLVTPADYEAAARRAQVRAVRRLAHGYLLALDRRLATGPQPASRPASRRPPPPAAAPRTSSPADAPAERGEDPRFGWHWTAYGVAAAAGVAVAVTGGLALAAEGDAAAQHAAGEVQATHDRADRADRLALAADVLLGVGIAAAVTGVVLQLLRRRHARRADRRAALVRQRGLGAALRVEF